MLQLINLALFIHNMVQKALFPVQSQLSLQRTCRKGMCEKEHASSEHCNTYIMLMCFKFLPEAMFKISVSVKISYYHENSSNYFNFNAMVILDFDFCFMTY
jgi:hypothetical protein